jgi:hypothetical protein
LWCDGKFSYQAAASGPAARTHLDRFLRSLTVVGRTRWLSTARSARHHSLSGHT